MFIGEYWLLDVEKGNVDFLIGRRLFSFGIVVSFVKVSFFGLKREFLFGSGCWRLEVEF